MSQNCYAMPMFCNFSAFSVGSLVFFNRCASQLLFNTSQSLAYSNAESIPIKQIYFKHLANLTGWIIGTYNASRGTATSTRLMTTPSYVITTTGQEPTKFAPKD